MFAYHEKEPGSLSENKIYFTKSITTAPSKKARLHWHNSYEFLYVRRGFGEQHINNQVLPFMPGSVAVICPGDIHTTVATSPDGYEIDVLQLVDEYFGEREALLWGLKSTVALLKQGEIEQLFDQVSQCNYATSACKQLTLAGAVFALCGILLEHCTATQSFVTRSKFATDVCNMLAVSADLRLSSTARHFGYSPEHFSRKFRVEVGISYQHYCERIKMQRIMRGLSFGELSIEELAQRTGYSDASSFTRAFKRIYGMTPGAYRSLKINSDGGLSPDELL